MKAASVLLSLLVWSSANAKTVGLQYNYFCENEDGPFEVTIVKTGSHKSVEIDGEYIDSERIAIEPRLGSKNARIYFLGAGDDEQNNTCVLTYTNARSF